MAAFIQKLFRTRKATPIKNPGTPPNNETSEPSGQENREALLKEQQGELSGSPEQSVLAGLAIEGATAAIRLQAARELREEAYLQKVQKQAKGRDKGVYQAVKQALQNLREQKAAEQATQEKIAELAKQAQEQANSEDTKLFQPRLEALLGQWRRVEAQASPEQAQQFLEAIQRCHERQAEIEQAQLEAQRHREQAEQRVETLKLLKQTLTELTAQEQHTLPSTSALDALQKTQENRWLEATRDTDVNKQEQKQYEQLMLALRNYLSATRRLDQAQDTIASLEQADEATDQHAEAARNLLKDIDWPADFPLPGALSALKKLAGKPKTPTPADTSREQQKALGEALKSTLPKLESALEAKHYKESKQLLKTAQNQFQQLDGRHRKDFQARMNLLDGQFRELSDWQGFATEPKQIALCEQMEHLAEQPIDPEAKAERIKELQTEWRGLGGSSDRTLWTRFKSASDQAYEPCKAYFEAKSDLKQANIQKREAICEQLTTFLEHADWSSIDWKVAERIHQTARQEWKSAWPVDFRNNRPVQKRFDSLLKQLESPLNEERKRNEAIKQAIVERAEALIHHDPLQEAMDEAKALQPEWQAVGITRHREDRKLWKAFRKACDAIFARREANRSARQEQTEQADLHAQDVLASLADIDESVDDDTLNNARNTLNKLNGQPLSGEIKEQVQQLRKRLAEVHQARQLQQKLQTWQALVTQRASGQLSEDDLPKNWPGLADPTAFPDNRDLIIRAEILTSTPSPETDQKRRMEIQVQRLADGMGGGEATSTPAAIEQLIATWCLQPDADDITPEYARRLNIALNSLLKPE